MGVQLKLKGYTVKTNKIREIKSRPGEEIWQYCSRE